MAEQKGNRLHPMLKSQTNQNDKYSSNIMNDEIEEYSWAHLLKQDSFQYLTSFQAQKAHLHSAVSVQHLVATRY
jgi:hypothetical protein